MQTFILRVTGIREQEKKDEEKKLMKEYNFLARKILDERYNSKILPKGAFFIPISFLLGEIRLTRRKKQKNKQI